MEKAIDKLLMESINNSAQSIFNQITNVQYTMNFAPPIEKDESPDLEFDVVSSLKSALRNSDGNKN